MTKSKNTMARHPMAATPGNARSSMVRVNCIHCSQTIAVRQWDYWNGFLVTCPYCGGAHGKRWNLGRNLVAALFLNALAYAFTLRPKRATLAILISCVVLVGLWYGLALIEPDDFERGLLIFLIAVGGAMGFNAFLVIRHQVRMHRAPPPRTAPSQTGDRVAQSTGVIGQEPGSGET